MSEIAQRTPQEAVIAQIRSEQFLEQLSAALPEGVSVERFARITITALLEDVSKQRDPDKQLINADRSSLFQAVLKCAQDGLIPDGRHAALVVFKGKVQYLPMIHGFRQIVAEYGWTLRTGAVRENDEFDWSDEPQWIKFRKAPTGQPRGELTYAFATATHPVKGREQLVMTRDEVLKRMAVAKSDNVWKAWADEMWAKTPGKALVDELPLDPIEKKRLARVIEADQLARGEAANTLYGATTSEQEAPGPQAAAASSEPAEAPAEEPPPAGDAAPSAGAGEPEPGISEGAADDQALADAAAGFVPPSGKFSAGGAHGPKTLREILALGPDGERWLKWALANVSSPQEYVAAVTSFSRVYAVAAYQEWLAKSELGA